MHSDTAMGGAYQAIVYLGVSIFRSCFEDKL
jgi:hypothetical protein